MGFGGVTSGWKTTGGEGGTLKLSTSEQKPSSCVAAAEHKFSSGVTEGNFFVTFFFWVRFWGRFF
jgi:hypothetical protein